MTQNSSEEIKLTETEIKSREIEAAAYQLYRVMDKIIYLAGLANAAEQSNAFDRASKYDIYMMAYMENMQHLRGYIKGKLVEYKQYESDNNIPINMAFRLLLRELS